MIEFKEVTTKKGKHLVFCDFRELLMEAYGVKTFDQVLPNETGTGEYIIHCPFCKQEGHTKHKLYIKSDLTVGHCFVCCRNYVHTSDEIDLSFSAPDLVTSFCPWGKKKFELPRLLDPEWSLEKLKYECEDYDEQGYRYLLSRHKYMSELYKTLDFKFLDGNIVMPFKYKGEAVYYQIRFSGNNSKIRYFFPPVDKKMPWIADHGEGIRKIIICEGIYDAISLLIQAPSYIPVAVLGSSINDYQMEFIREYVPEKILIYMDETQISRRIAEKVKSVIDYCPIGIIKSDGEDPEECMIRKMRALPGSEIGWIK